MIHKPANIAIQKLLLVYKPENKEVDTKTDNNAGRFIGTIERNVTRYHKGSFSLRC